MKYRLKTLEKIPTLHQGQFDDLKVETKEIRVWLSRMTIEDGMPYNNQVTIEMYWHPVKKYNSLGRPVMHDIEKPKVWQTVNQYEAK